MQITPEYLKEQGYTTKTEKGSMWMPLYFSKDRELYFVIDFKYGYVRITKFIDDKPKEVHEGYVASEEQFEEIINNIK